MSTGTAPSAEVYGAAAERTALAWQRTGLGVVIGCFVVFVTSFRSGAYPVGVATAGLGVLIAALSVLAFPTRRYLRGDPADSWLLLILVAASVGVLGLLAAVAAAIQLLA